MGEIKRIREKIHLADQNIQMREGNGGTELTDIYKFSKKVVVIRDGRVM